MTLVEVKTAVLGLFPLKVEDTFMYNDDVDSVDKVINTAVIMAKSRYDKIEGKDITGSQVLPRAASVISCVPQSALGIGIATRPVSIWSTLPIGNVGNLSKVRYFFTPEDKYLRLSPEGEGVHVEYTVDQTLLTVEDLNPIFSTWLIRYTVCLLKEKEGYLGSNATTTSMPFQFNYDAMRSEAQSEKGMLESDYNDMCLGTLAIRSN